MLDLEIKEYLSKVGIRRLHALDTALIEAFGQDEGDTGSTTHTEDVSSRQDTRSYPDFGQSRA